MALLAAPGRAGKLDRGERCSRPALLYIDPQPAAARGDQIPGPDGTFPHPAGIAHTLISAEGTLETAPAIGYADIISDLVSSGQTLRDNRLKPLADGLIQASQAALIANTRSLQI